MSFILYGGDKYTVEMQLKCEHIWHGPCMDNISRYFKCVKCFCLDRDLPDFNAHNEALKEEEKHQKDTLEQRDEEIKDLNNKLDELRKAFVSFAGSVDNVIDAGALETKEEV